MFSGIIYDTGKVRSVVPKSGVKILTIALQKDIIKPEKGMSVAVNGSCLTAISFKGKKEFSADVTEETLEKTNLKNAKTGDEVNIEFPLTADKFLSGHIVQGHVDTEGSVRSLKKTGDRVILEVEFPPALAKYIIEKGSVAVDGISLTAYNVEKDAFEVSVIPETWKTTIVKNYRNKDRVNLEFDVIGKYVEKFLSNK